MHLPIRPRDEPVACDSNKRTLWDILWSSIATIFACLWISVHPNVPGSKLRAHGSFFCRLQRLKLMLLAIFSPEVIIMWAFRQWSVARRAKTYNISMAQGFFISIGGFVDKDGHAAASDDLHTTADVISKFPQEELLDRSKGDPLSKLISLLQTTWFMVYHIARAVQSLPITQIETATLAFTLLNIGNYILWWHKPMDVQVPIILEGFTFPPRQDGDGFSGDQRNTGGRSTENETTTNQAITNETKSSICFQCAHNAWRFIHAMAKHTRNLYHRYRKSLFTILTARSMSLTFVGWLRAR
ncbi:uncharacterized protein EV420DRAFT_1316079 [Desarmillaria tabescens]